VGGERKRRAKEVVRRVLIAESVRGLVAEGREEEARLHGGHEEVVGEMEGEGVGGKDVQACIDDGEVL